MSRYCDKHMKTPTWGYHDCPACEVESLRAENASLRHQLEQIS